MENKKPQLKVTAELSEKQRKKKEEQAKKYWNSMITRKEAYNMVEGLQEQVRILFIQNRTLLEILEKKGVASKEDINEHSKEVIESLFSTNEQSKEQEQEKE